MENSLEKRITGRNVRKGVAIVREIHRERNEMRQIEQFNIKTYQKIHSPEYAIKREKSKRKDWCSRIEVNILKTGELNERDWRGRERMPKEKFWQQENPTKETEEKKLILKYGFGKQND